jgi:ATP-dependent Clp endopeptidase proteolytic subunit ClpP
MPNARSWYSVKALADNSAEIFIYDEIGFWGINASQFVSDLKAVAGKALTLRIHSPGGDVLDGHAIYSAIKRHSGGVTVQIDGLAASMASVIAMAGAPIKMAANGFLMIHNPSAGARGESSDLRQTADILDKMRDGLVNIYAGKTGMDASDIESMMDSETWLTAQDALDKGFIDEITDEIKVAASFDVSRFSKAPAALVDKSGKNNMEANLNEATEKLVAAQAQAQKNFSDFQTVSTERDEIKAKFEAAKTEFDANCKALNEKLEAKDIELAAKEAELVSAKAQLGTDAAKVNAEAVRILAASGHAPIALGEGIHGQPSNMSRADFAKLSASAKSNFSKSGGKITE